MVRDWRVLYSDYGAILLKKYNMAVVRDLRILYSDDDAVLLTINIIWPW